MLFNTLVYLCLKYNDMYDIIQVSTPRHIGGPYGPVKDEMYWPELVRRSEKCAGPVLMSRAAM